MQQIKLMMGSRSRLLAGTLSRDESVAVPVLGVLTEEDGRQEGVAIWFMPSRGGAAGR